MHKDVEDEDDHFDRAKVDVHSIRRMTRNVYRNLDRVLIGHSEDAAI